MIDAENLRTASVYINNQLLSRGLIRDGEEIDFADPTRRGRSSGSSSNGLGKEEAAALGETMGRVMSVVNDLILRRDRDASHREALGAALRTCRAESLRAADDISRLSARLAASERRVALAEAQANQLRERLALADQTTAQLRDELSRARAANAQTRAACATDVRRRDRQIDSLKKAVAEAGRVRGERGRAGVAFVTIEGEVRDSVGAGRTSAGADLGAESNDLLARMVRTLGEENERLTRVARDVVAELKAISGFDVAVERAAELGVGEGHVAGENGTAATGSTGSSGAPRHSTASSSTIFRNPSTSELESDFAQLVAHLRTLLTNPSFVPIEEVEVRDEEIQRLRDGWDKMETRWKEAVHLMDGWRRRMAAGGKTVNVEEIRMGLRLSPVRVGGVGETEEGVLGAGASRLRNLAGEQQESRLSAVAEEDSQMAGEEEQRQQQQEQQQPPKHQQSDAILMTPSPAESLHLVPAPIYEIEEADDDVSDSDKSSSFGDDLDIEEMDVEEPNVQILQQSAHVQISRDEEQPATTAAPPTVLPVDSSPPLPPVPTLSPLKETGTAANRGGGLLRDRARPGAAAAAVTTATTTTTLSRKRPAADLSATVEDEEPPKTIFSRVPPPQTRFAVPSTAQATRQQSPQKRQKLPSEQPAATLTKPPSATVTTAAADDSAMPAKTGSPAAAANAPAPVTGRRPAATMAAAPSPAPGVSTGSNTSSQPSTAKKTAAASSQDATMPPPPTTISRTNSKRRAPDGGVVPGSSSRLPLPRNGIPPAASGVLPQPVQSPLTTATIAAKLAASAREADAARVRAKLKAARLGRRGAAAAPGAASSAVGRSNNAPAAAGATATIKPVPAMAVDDNDKENEAGIDELALSVDTHTQQPVTKRKRTLPDASSGLSKRALASPHPATGPAATVGGASADCVEGDGGSATAAVADRPRKRERRASKVASRRRSTLSPWELESLISGSVTVGRDG